MHQFWNLKLTGISMLVVMLVAACGESVEPAKDNVTPRLVRTITVNQAGEFRRREFPGVIDAAQRADLSFRVAGKLQAIEVAESDEVNAGQVIARLDPEDFETRLASIRADYERAKADYERAEGLVGNGFISRADFDKLTAQFTNAQSQLDAAERDLESTSLTAPFGGVVAQRHVDNFEEVNAKQPIVTLHDLAQLQVAIDIPESVMIRVRPDRNPSQLYAVFDGIPGQQFPLTLLEVSSEPDPASRTYKATFTMSAIEERVILPGMTVTVVVQAPHTEGPASQVTIPAEAVMEDRNGRFVWVAEPGEEDLATIRRRDVETGELTSEGLSVLSGISSGDQVVTAGMSRLVEGQEVRTGTGTAP